MTTSDVLKFGGETKRARVEIIPLIDVIFFLLATFVLFTLSLNKIRSVPLTLPIGGRELDATGNVTIQVSDATTVYWNSDLTNFSELPARLAQYKSQAADPRILIAGDERARFGATAQVLDQVRLAGITEVSVETRTRPVTH